MVILDLNPREKISVYLIGATTQIKNSPKFNILLKLLSLNPPSLKVYIMHDKTMTITNLEYIFCTTEYNYS